MANVNSLTSASSTASSLYGSRNILSGLASGLDTEAMIENSISGYKTKITQLEQSQTKIQWKQDSYREIISLAANMNTKYSSYTSSTNLSSASFFDGAAVTSTLGTYANMVSAQGTTTSAIKINSVTQMAASASYSVSLPSLSAAQGEEQEETTLATKLSDLSISLTNGTINGVEINFTDTLTSESTIQDVLKAINNSNAGITASYSKLTNQVYFTTNDTGSDQKIEFDGDMLSDLFGTPVEGDEGYSAGSDAVLSIKVNGQTIEYTSKSNTIDMDGMKVTLKGTFTPTGTETGVQFGGSANSDKIVDAVKSFVADYNNLMSKLRTAFTTQPAKQSNGSSYDPLTENDKNTMSESAIKNYEEQAKQGILFGDSDLSAMYSQLVSKLTSSGAESSKLAEIGITTSYNRESGLTTLVLDENKLRTSLESGTDKVKNVFVNSAYGANDGLVGRVKSTLDTYASTSSGSPGILVSKAGTKLSPVSLLNNTLQKQISNVQEQIERWQTKMSNRIDYYTKQFSRLEQLMNTMNSQSSMLAGMMGG